MAAMILPFLTLAVIGSAAVLAVHVSALLGITWPFEHYLKFLGPGVFVVFFPTIFVMNQLTRNFKQKDVWRAALRGCPRWMRRAFYVVCGYAWAGSFVLPFLYGGGMESVANTARSISAVMLIFYLASVVVPYSAMQVQRFDYARRCLNGHPISPLAKYCEECGAPSDVRSAPDTSPARGQRSD